MTGTITRVFADKGFGFIHPADGSPDVFFHCKALDAELPFDVTLTERRVQFEIINSDKGPRASNVRPAD